ncbi:MAG TPA: branched-chain amino acid ABC transporter substrate-binding protein [Solirubrobacteraceae bacterium]
MTEGWAFLVARGRHASYRTVLAPDFLVDLGRHVVLAESLRGSGVVAGGLHVVTLPDGGFGQATAHYTVNRVTHADIDGPGQGDELMTDEHGRPLEILYGVLTREPLNGALAEEDLLAARVQALAAYRRFLDTEQEFAVERANASLLRPATPVDPPPTPRRLASDPAGTDTAPAAVSPRRYPARLSPGGADDAGPGHARDARLDLERTATGAAPSDPAPPAGGVRRHVPAPAKIAAGVGALLIVLGAWMLLRKSTDELTIYASLPMQGPQRERASDMDRAMRLALEQAEGRAGRFKVRYRLLDDSSPMDRGWTSEAVARNATKAAEDEHTAVYIGEFNSGATAISILILSGKRVGQISPSSTAVGLTSRGPGAVAGEPDRHYQDGYRNFVRIVPNDTVQGKALAAIMLADGCQRVGIVNDGGVYGAGLARNVRIAARDRRLPIVFDESIGSPTVTSSSMRAARAAQRSVDCFLFSGDTRSSATAIYAAMAARLSPAARLYGADGVSDSGLTDVDQGGVSRNVASRLQLTIPALGPRSLGVAGRRFLKDFAIAYPRSAEPDPYALYAYESMKLALDAIERSESGKRQDVVKALFATKDRRSVLGRYSIKNTGDTTSTTYGRFAIRAGRPWFLRRIEIGGP